jgi:cyclic-di-GMP phosphodiesterase TipF (flagellum assembly factor)
MASKKSPFDNLFNTSKSKKKKNSGKQDASHAAGNRAVVFHSSKAQKKVIADKIRRRRMWIGAGIGSVGGLFAVYGISRIASPDFTMISTALIALCGVIAYDIISRRSWEIMISARYENLAHNHDRLVREVARTRNDLAVFKDTLSKAGQQAREESRFSGHGVSAESRMLDTIIDRLERLSEAAPLPIGTIYDEAVLALEMSPHTKKGPVLQIQDAENIASAVDRLKDEQIRELILNAVHNNQIDVFIQKVVNLPQRKPRILEVFARIHAGEDIHVAASRYLEVAQKHDLMTAVDNLLLLRCLQMLRDTKDDTEALPCCLNITAATLHDSGFMNDLVTFLAQHKTLAARLIFELPQKELVDMDENITPILKGLSQLGCRFSMDHVESQRFNIHRLKAQHVRFIKLNAPWLIRESRSPGGLGRLTNIKKQLDGFGIDMIVEKIESEEDLRELLDIGVDYGQGYLFGKPQLANPKFVASKKNHSA